MNKQQIINVLSPLGEPRDGQAWLDYTAYGLTSADVSILVKLVQDDSFLDEEGNAYWVPLHAWRALKAFMPQGVAALIEGFNLLAEDDWALEEIPLVIAAAKDKAFQPLITFLQDAENDTEARGLAAASLAQIALEHKNLRKTVVDHLVKSLQQTTAEDAVLNGHIIAQLVRLRAGEAIDAIRKAFHEQRVDITVGGDLEDIEMDLGLRTERSTPRPNYQQLAMQEDDDDGEWEAEEPAIAQVIRTEPKIGRNDVCPCGSGKKYKKCCMP